MAEVVADRLLSSGATMTPAELDMSTQLKLLGVDVAGFGDAHAPHRGRWRWWSATPSPEPVPSLLDGCCLDADGVSVPVYAVRITGGSVQIGIP